MHILLWQSGRLRIRAKVGGRKLLKGRICGGVGWGGDRSTRCVLFNLQGMGVRLDGPKRQKGKMVNLYCTVLYCAVPGSN